MRIAAVTILTLVLATGCQTSAPVVQPAARQPKPPAPASRTVSSRDDRVIFDIANLAGHDLRVSRPAQGEAIFVELELATPDGRSMSRSDAGGDSFAATGIADPSAVRREAIVRRFETLPSGGHMRIEAPAAWLFSEVADNLVIPYQDGEPYVARFRLRLTVEDGGKASVLDLAADQVCIWTRAGAALTSNCA